MLYKQSMLINRTKTTMRLFVGVSSTEFAQYRSPQKRCKEPLAGFSRFNTIMESAMEQQVVVSSFILMNPKLRFSEHSYLQDINLLNEARENLESIIDGI